MAPLHVATLTVQKELPKYEIILLEIQVLDIFSSVSVATLTEVDPRIFVR